MFVYVQCGCGKRLRAADTDAGGLIRCWNCHEMATVPRLRKQRTGLFRRTLWGPDADEFALKILIGLGVTAALVPPQVGLWAAIGFLVLLAPGYVDIFAAEGRGDESEQPALAAATPARKPLGAMQRALLGYLALAGLIAPLAFRYSVQHLPGVPTRFEGLIFWSVWLASWLLVPLIVFLIAGCDSNGRLGLRRAAAIARSSWPAALFGLALLPIAVLIVEAALVLGSGFTNLFPAVVYNAMPLPEDGSAELTTFYMKDQRIDQWMISLAIAPSPWQHYRNNLARGFTLSGAFVNALALVDPRRLHAPSPVSQVGEDAYLLLRIGANLVIWTAIATAAIAQARRLGRLSFREPIPYAAPAPPLET